MSKQTVKRFSDKRLPDKNCLCSSVKDGTTGNNVKKFSGHISNENYLTHKKIWNEFSMTNMGDYHDYYQKKQINFKKDVLLLADIFQKFIDTSLTFYGLNPCLYFSSPGLSWDAMLRETGVKLAEVSEIDMH